MERRRNYNSQNHFEKAGGRLLPKQGMQHRQNDRRRPREQNKESKNKRPNTAKEFLAKTQRQFRRKDCLSTHGLGITGLPYAKK